LPRWCRREKSGRRIIAAGYSGCVFVRSLCDLQTYVLFRGVRMKQPLDYEDNNRKILHGIYYCIFFMIVALFAGFYMYDAILTHLEKMK
jgi:hypothetical protein